MKKLLLIFTGILLSVMSYAQLLEKLSIASWIYESWEENNIHNYTYDENNFLIESTLKYKAGVWVYVLKYTYENDNNGVLQTEKVDYWDRMWVKSSESTYSYNSAGFITSRINKNWNGREYVNNYNFIYTYDNNNNLISDSREIWNSEINEWTNNRQTDYILNEDGITLSYKIKKWENDNWVDSLSYYYYYSNNIMDSSIRKIFFNDDWLNVTKTEYFYNIENNVNNLISYKWDTINSFNNWVPFQKGIETFNENGKIDSEISQDWDKETNTWINSVRFKYQYSPKISIINNQLFSYNIFPNPASDKINISLDNNYDAKIDIMDLQGKVLYSETFNGKERSVDISNLSPGIYFIKTEINNDFLIDKFIKN